MASRCAFPPLALGSFTLPSLADLLALLLLGFVPPPIPLPRRPDMHVDVPPLPGGTLSFKLLTVPSLSDLLSLFLLSFNPPPLPFGFSIKQPGIPGLDALLDLLLGFIDFPEFPQPYCFLDDKPE